MKLLLFAASHRPQSVNRKLCQLAADYANAQGVETDLADYGDFDMPIYNDEICSHKGVPDDALRLARRAQDCAGLVIASPEYNWSVPGSLKNILDWTSRISPNPLAGKTALLMSATPGLRGGVLGLQHLKLPLEALQLFVFPKMVLLGQSHLAFDEQDAFVNPDQGQLFTAILDQYILFTKKLAG